MTERKKSIIQYNIPLSKDPQRYAKRPLKSKLWAEHKLILNDERMKEKINN